MTLSTLDNKKASIYLFAAGCCAGSSCRATGRIRSIDVSRSGISRRFINGIPRSCLAFPGPGSDIGMIGIGGNIGVCGGSRSRNIGRRFIRLGRADSRRFSIYFWVFVTKLELQNKLHLYAHLGSRYYCPCFH